MKTGERIVEIRKRLGISRGQLAKALGISMPTLWRWEAGERSIKEDRLKEIALYLKVSVSELIGDVAVLKNETADAVSNTDRIISNDIYQDWIKLPLYKNLVDIHLQLRDRNSAETIPLPCFFVGTLSSEPAKKPYVIVVDGSSMLEARIEAGAYAVVNPAEEVLDGDAVLVKMGLRYAVRWVYWNDAGGGEFRASSSNFPVKRFDEQKLKSNQYAILGKIMWTFSKPLVGL